MPELPELQAHAERLSDRLGGEVLDGFRALTFTALKTVLPAPDDAYGHQLVEVGRIGKYLLVRFEPVTFVVHLMQGGRLEPDAKRSAKPRGGLARWTFGPDKALLECRGIGRKGDSADDRLMRIDHHNAYWGPFGRNVPEDAIAAERCDASFRPGAARHQIIARDEGGHGQDDALLRNFYGEWGRLMGRPAHKPINQPTA